VIWLESDIQFLDGKRLEPGKTHARWFRFKEQNMPDVACALTIEAERGRKEQGKPPRR
jgi:hypothetical protein